MSDFAFPQFSRDPWGAYTQRGGLTKRELFACEAMKALLSNGTFFRAQVAQLRAAGETEEAALFERITSLGVQYADALLERLAATKEDGKQ